MNAHKGILCLGCIALGIIVGVSLSLVSSGGNVVFGIALGGLLGGLVYCAIQGAVSRGKKVDLPYDYMDERHQNKQGAPPQTPETRVRGMQDNLMSDIMSYPRPHR